MLDNTRRLPTRGANTQSRAGGGKSVLLLCEPEGAPAGGARQSARHRTRSPLLSVVIKRAEDNAGCKLASGCNGTQPCDRHTSPTIGEHDVISHNAKPSLTRHATSCWRTSASVRLAAASGDSTADGSAPCAGPRMSCRARRTTSAHVACGGTWTTTL